MQSINKFVDTQLNFLFQQADAWRVLDSKIKQFLPNNLHQYLKVVCIKNAQLTIVSHHSMAANRLKLLLPDLIRRLNTEDNLSIQSIKIIRKPQQQNKHTIKNFHISQHALGCFEKTSQKVKHHPELARALQQLVKNHKN